MIGSHISVVQLTKE